MSKKVVIPYEPTANDVRELQRVFDFLCDFTAKQRIRHVMQPKQERLGKIQMYKKNPDAVKIVDEYGQELPEAVIDAELQRLDTEIRQMEGQIAAIDAKPQEEKKIQHKDLMNALLHLGKQTDKVRRRARPPVHRSAGASPERAPELQRFAECLLHTCAPPPLPSRPCRRRWRT